MFLQHVEVVQPKSKPLLLRQIPPADSDDVIWEQFEYLFEHWIRSRKEPQICAGARGPICNECARFARVKGVLMDAFTEPALKAGWMLSVKTRGARAA